MIPYRILCWHMMVRRGFLVARDEYTRWTALYDLETTLSRQICVSAYGTYKQKNTLPAAQKARWELGGSLLQAELPKKFQYSRRLGI